MDILKHYFDFERSHGKVIEKGKYNDIISRHVCAYVIIETDTAVISYFFDNHGKIRNRHAEMKGV